MRPAMCEKGDGDRFLAAVDTAGLGREYQIWASDYEWRHV